MKTIECIKLSDVLRLVGKPKYVLGTTYTLSLAFFESLVYPVVRNNQLKSAVIVLGVAEGDKVSLIAGVTPDLTGRFKAGELVNHVASQVGGKGGGRPDMAQAGGTQPANLANALASVSAWVSER